MKLEPNTTIVQSDQIIQASFGDEVLAFDGEKGRYYGAEGVGSVVLSMIGSSIAISEICDRLMDDYEIDRGKCEAEVIAFLNNLLEKGVITIVPGHPSE